MNFLSISPPIPGTPDVVRATIEVADGVRLHQVKITPDCVLARNATFSPETAKQISDLFFSGKGARQHDRVS